MKKILLVTSLVLAASLILLYFTIKERMKTDFVLNAKVSAVMEQAGKVKELAASLADASKKAFSKSGKFVSKMIPALPAAGGEPIPASEIYLKKGGVIKGCIIRQNSEEYVVDWKGGEFVVKADQVEQVKQLTAKEVEWPYKHDIVIKKTNGIICDGKITDVDEDMVTVSLDEYGEGVEMGIPRREVEYLIFAPVCDRNSEEAEKRLKKLFPKMKVYKEGNIVLFTDSFERKARTYEKIVRRLYTELYLKFFGLFKGRKPVSQSFIVVFDDPVTYTESTGMTWYIPGFFNPDEQVLYLYNAFGDRIEEMLFEMLGEATESIDRSIEAQKERYGIDERYDIFIDGMTKEFKDKFWKAYNIYKKNFVDETKSVLRHELTHEILHNWGLQSIIISRPSVNKEEALEKKKEFIDATDWRKKKKLLDEIMKIERPEEIEMAASGSWLAEGMATYCAPEPVGKIDEEFLFAYQDGVDKKKIAPVEFLTSFERGSFTGVLMSAKYDLYAQSWAFVHFLMDKYPAQFIVYQQKIADRVRIRNAGAESAPSEKDDFSLLLACLGMDLETLEKEFSDYMSTFEKVEDPFVKRYMEIYEIWHDLMGSSA